MGAKAIASKRVKTAKNTKVKKGGRFEVHNGPSYLEKADDTANTGAMKDGSSDKVGTPGK